MSGQELPPLIAQGPVAMPALVRPPGCPALESARLPGSTDPHVTVHPRRQSCLQGASMPMQMPAFSPAQISESRAEASGMLSRQPRLETRDPPSAASQQPYDPHMMSQTPMIGGDMGVYVKWALLLQEQLDHVQGERTKLQEHVTQLQIENQQLQMVRWQASTCVQIPAPGMHVHQRGGGVWSQDPTWLACAVDLAGAEGSGWAASAGRHPGEQRRCTI